MTFARNINYRKSEVRIQNPEERRVYLLLDSGFWLLDSFFHLFRKNGVNNPNNGTIRRNWGRVERKRRLFAAAPEDQFADAGADGIHRNHGLSGILQLRVERLNDQQFPPHQRIILYRRNDCANDSRYVHSG